MCSGKTTVGKLLAQLCHKAFYDLDQLISIKSGLSVPEIFENHGEVFFRQLELDALRELFAAPDLNFVLATGGGTVTSTISTELLHSRSFCIFLSPPWEELKRRLAKSRKSSSRPLLHLLSMKELKELYKTRLPAYNAASHISFCGEVLAAEKLATEIFAVMGELRHG